MKTDNELIAEFMGLSVRKHSTGLLYICNDEGMVDYTAPDCEVYSPNRDWNQLMAVIQKILVMRPVKDFEAEFHKMFVIIERELTYSYEIAKVHEKIIAFIKWYNKNNQ